MNVRRTNTVLWAIAGALAVGAVACAVVGVTAGMSVSGEGAVGGDRVAASSPATTRESPLTLGDFESIWTLRLRGGASDGGGTASGDVARNGGASRISATTTAGGPFVLVGTIGDSLAMIRNGTGAAVELKGVGETANGAKIVAIRPSQVDVEIDGRRQTIARPHEAGGGK